MVISEGYLGYDIFNDNNWNQPLFVTIRATFQFLTSRKLLIRLELETVNIITRLGYLSKLIF